ncbi:MAG: hypothetical protein ACREDA_04370 [Methylocella sp.]
MPPPLYSDIVIVAEPRGALVRKDYHGAYSPGRFHKPELERAIYDDIERNSADPKRFVWTKSAHAIILKVNRGRAALQMPPLACRDQLYIHV